MYTRRDLSIDTLEALVDAPKPRQLVFGDGHATCFAVDTIRCRTAALRQNTEPLPAANVLDKIERWHDDADFFYLDAGAVAIGQPMASAPCYGPG